tara:strand:- start:1065 stop:1916 length:852 start_codon:yes stop_codon:yes gene_type:complete
MKNIHDNSIDLSLVVATHQGKNRLEKLIKSVLNSGVIPREIIIVGTNKEDIDNIKKYNDNLNIIFKVSKYKNQVYQRKIGLDLVSSNFILQLDDDIRMEKNSLSILYNEIKNKNFKRIIAGTLVNENHEPADIRWVNAYNKYYLIRLIIFLLNNFKKVKPNTLIFSGRPIPHINNEKSEIEWLNSSLCFHKDSLKDYSRYKSFGKSYYEDIFTSHNYYCKGYKLEKISEAILIHPNTKKFSLLDHIKSIKNQYIIVKTYSKSYIFFFLDILFFSLIFLIRKIK